jgi:hypothetical protein
MDGERFDALARRVGEPTTRRAAVRSLSGGAFGVVLGLLGRAESEAGKKKGKKNKGKKKKRDCPENAVDCGGSCAGLGQCCPGEKRCGGGCIAGTSCCPYTERQCPNGSCVPIVGGCCAEAECGDCGTCLGGRCIEVPGICDSDNCEVCNTFSWTCQQMCTGGGFTCCGGQCCATDDCYDCDTGTGTCTYRCPPGHCCFRNVCLDTPCGG